MKNKMTDESGRHVPLRMCVGCRQMKPKAELMRVAKASDGVELEIKGGRGAYVCRNRDCIEKARKMRALQRGIRGPVDEAAYDRLLEKLEG